MLIDQYSEILIEAIKNMEMFIDQGLGDTGWDDLKAWEMGRIELLKDEIIDKFVGNWNDLKVSSASFSSINMDYQLTTDDIDGCLLDDSSWFQQYKR